MESTSSRKLRGAEALIFIALLAFVWGSSQAHRGHMKAQQKSGTSPAPDTTGPAQRPKEAFANAFCPVRPDEEIMPNRFVDYRGKRVYFCCEKCRKKFLAEPESYLTNLPQFGGSGPLVKLDAETGAPTAGKKVGFIAYLGRFHPLFVHFPIALILFAGFCEFLFMVQGKEFLSVAARFVLYYASALAIVAVVLGLADATGTPIDATLQGTFEGHRLMGVTTAVMALLAALLARMASRQRSAWCVRLYRLALLLAMASVAVTGHLGGTLVFGQGYLALPW